MKLTVMAHPNSKRPRVEKDSLGTMHVYIHEPPLDGRANEAVRDALADFLNIKKYRLSLIKGHQGKKKIFEVHG